MKRVYKILFALITIIVLTLGTFLYFLFKPAPTLNPNEYAEWLSHIDLPENIKPKEYKNDRPDPFLDDVYISIEYSIHDSDISNIIEQCIKNDYVPTKNDYIIKKGLQLEYYNNNDSNRHTKVLLDTINNKLYIEYEVM